MASPRSARRRQAATTPAALVSARVAALPQSSASPARDGDAPATASSSAIGTSHRGIGPSIGVQDGSLPRAAAATPAANAAGGSEAPSDLRQKVEMPLRRDRDAVVAAIPVDHPGLLVRALRRVLAQLAQAIDAVDAGRH